MFIDNASTDRSAAIVQEFSLRADCRYLYRQLNHLAQARNDALHLSQAEWIYFIDSDCELQPTTFVELLVHANLQDLKTAGWGGAQNFPIDGEFLCLLQRFRQSYLGHFGSVQMRLGNESENESVDHLSTSHVLYRKSSLLEISGFDPRLKDSAEDLDLSLRLKKSKKELTFIPSSQVNHYVASNFSEWARKAFRNGQWQTRLAFYNTEIIKTQRFWTPIILLALLNLLFFGPLFNSLIGLFFLYSLVFFINYKTVNLKLYMLFVLTHGLYFIGGVWGFAKGLVDFAFSKQAPRNTKNEWISQAGK